MQWSAAAGNRDKVKMNSSPAIKLPRTVVFIGLMGAGKSRMGRELSARISVPYVDADAEIEAAAGCSVEEIFKQYGEAEFRSAERRIIARLLEGPARILSTGGGAFMDPEIRQSIREQGISVWLRADLDLLLKRTARRDNRPLLKTGDPREILSNLMEIRYPVYAEADLTVDCVDGPPDITLERIITALEGYIEAGGPS